MNRALSEASLDNRWLIYALNPAGVKLNPDQETSLFDRQRQEKRRLAHQLWALCHLRRVSGDESVSDGLMAGLCQRMAEGNGLDIPVHDLYCERVAFPLIGGHAELINRRWVVRMIENQRQDGGRRDPWYGFSSTLEWGDNPQSNEHTTLLALWALRQVKYGHPEAFTLPDNR
ncbi:MAG: hypothetical protein IID40_09965 [Planctomycetes bacterium]|nr:hypothetical protein [Planctomycetota bacterium]